MLASILLGTLPGLVACGSTPEPKRRGRIDVAPPTGDVEKDRRHLAAAFAAARPGELLVLSAGTYVIGGPPLELATSDVELRGADAGTVLQGIDPAARAQMGAEEFFRAANGLLLSGGRQVVRGITFTDFASPLVIAGPGGESPNLAGGHELVDNEVRACVSLEIAAAADLPIVVRANRFRNTYHAVAVLGRNVHVLDNAISAPEPERVPYGWPSLAIGIRPLPGHPCCGHRVIGNQIEGHSDAIAVAVAPPDGDGAQVRDIAIRANRIAIHPVLHSRDAGEALAGTPVIGVAIRLLNAQRAVAHGRFEFPGRPTDGWPAAFAQAAITEVAITENQIDGAIGVAIELLDSDHNTVADNRIGPLTAMSNEDARRLIENWAFGIGPGAWVRMAFDTANGSAVWVSPGSVGNAVRQAPSAVAR